MRRSISGSRTAAVLKLTWRSSGVAISMSSFHTGHVAFVVLAHFDTSVVDLKFLSFLRHARELYHVLRYSFDSKFAPEVRQDKANFRNRDTNRKEQ
jgi:hypothetical protein